MNSNQTPGKEGQAPQLSPEEFYRQGVEEFLREHMEDAVALTKLISEDVEYYGNIKLQAAQSWVTLFYLLGLSDVSIEPFLKAITKPEEAAISWLVVQQMLMELVQGEAGPQAS